MDIEDLGNNKWLINDVEIYAPNLEAAKAKYEKRIEYETNNER